MKFIDKETKSEFEVLDKAMLCIYANAERYEEVKETKPKKTKKVEK